MGFRKEVLNALALIRLQLLRIESNDFGVAKEREKDRIFTVCRDNPKKIRKYIKKYPAPTTRSPIGQAHFEVLRWLDQQEDLEDDVPF